MHIGLSACLTADDPNVTSFPSIFSYLAPMNRIFATLFAFFLLPMPLIAQEVENVVTVDLVPGWRTAEGTHLAGLRISLAPHWKTYWRAPGPAGLPPAFDWSGSQNITDAVLHWPTPELLDVNGMESFGYNGSVLIPIELSLEDSEQTAHAKGQVEIGVCNSVCIPFTAQFDIALPVAAQRSPPIIAALLDQPLDGLQAGFAPVSCRFRPNGKGIRIEAHLPEAAKIAATAGVIEFASKDIWIAETMHEMQGDTMVFTADAIALGTAPMAIDRHSLRLTVLTTNNAYEFSGCQG